MAFKEALAAAEEARTLCQDLQNPECIGYVALGPPLDYAWALYIRNGSSLLARAKDSAGKPKLLLVGTRDQFCSEASFSKFVAELPEPKKAEILDGVDHFSLFQRLAAALAEWIPEAFGVADLRAFAASGGSVGQVTS